MSTALTARGEGEGEGERGRGRERQTDGQPGKMWTWQATMSTEIASPSDTAYLSQVRFVAVFCPLR